MAGIDTIELFYSHHCVACPEARALLRGVTDARPGVVAVEHDIDGPEGLARAREYRLIAVPAFVVN
ncbi:MAG: hypothetical protein Q7J25_08710, partial [Vicinamibacterales bacterium]|nr:hypothetical protein [Vicinamibacterales bacterium]